MFKRLTVLGSAFLFVGCSHGAKRTALDQAPPPQEVMSSALAPAPDAQQRNQIVPLVDAHQHLMGARAMALTVRLPSPTAVVVRGAVADLLSARQKGVDEASYNTLFTRDAMIYAEEHGRWWTGAARILDALSNFDPKLRFVPTSYAVDRSAGYVAGVLRKATGEDTHTFLLGIRRDPDSRWRIATEMKQPIAPLTYAPVIDAEKVIEVLDDAGIRYATVLSVAYWFGDPEKPVADRWEGTRAENDWVIAQTQKYPDRLFPFCGINPLDDYAIAELDRCAAIPAVRGVKIHRNSKFDPARPADLEKLQQFFRAANRHKLAIVIHLRGDPQLYIDHLLPAAPDVPIQIAHMGSGLSVLRLFAEAIAAGKPGTKNLWFDWTQFLPIEGLWSYGLPDPNLSGSISPENKARVADVMRKIGLDRILYGSDMPLAWNPTPRQWWRKTILTLPLSDDEIRNIADNVPPYISAQR